MSKCHNHQLSAVELHLSLYAPCRSGVLQSILKKDTAEEWLANLSVASVHCRMVAARIAAAGTVVGHTAVDTVGTVVARTAVVVDIATVVVPRAAAEMVLDHRVVEVDPDYNS